MLTNFYILINPLLGEEERNIPTIVEVELRTAPLTVESSLQSFGVTDGGF